MKIVVIGPTASWPKLPASNFVLRQDNWNDYSFQTLYQLYLYTDENEPDLIGSVKVLKRGQKSSDGLQLPEGPLTPLGGNYCSVGQSLDYYERLAGIAPELRVFLLESLRDIVHLPELVEKFQDEEGWKISLFRDFTESDFLGVARVLLERKYDEFPDLHNLSFTIDMKGWAKPVTMRFDAPEGGKGTLPFSPFAPPVRGMPDRVAVLIGRNGSGKSTVLANLARILHAPPDGRRGNKLSELGQIAPSGLGFTRIVTIAYSAFDAFDVPGISRSERAQIAKEMKTGKGRYVFCGLRDIVQELENWLERTEDNPPGEFHSEDTTDRVTGRTLLKSVDQQAREFVQTLEHIKNQGRDRHLEWALAPLYEDPSFHNLYEDSDATIFGSDPYDAFMKWSTGHKIVLQIVASLVAYTERKSIVLFDEPETHLHPPLLAALMHSFRTVLEINDAFAIIATHSPVVLQETMSRHVHYVHREGGQIKVREPRIQTFGENIGTITSEVFDLTSNVTDYHRLLDNLVNEHGDIEQIEALFDKSLSMQARAYLLSRYAEKSDEVG